MPQSSGFIDLRLSHAAQTAGEDSVWPSFTDIMTVIVMIFMLTLVVIMLRNSQLDQDVSSLQQANRQSTQENQALTVSVESLRQELAVQQATEKRLAAEKARLDQELESTLLKNTQLSTDIGGLQAENKSLVTEQAVSKDQIAQLQGEKSQLQDEEARLKQAVNQFTEQLEALKIESAQDLAALTTTNKSLTENLTAVNSQLARLNAALAQSEVEYSSLEGEYASLDAKYRRLVRPARSSVGKYVVDVRLTKTAAGFQYQIRQPSDSAAQTVDRNTLEQRLAELKAQHGKALYTKLIIDDDSSLTYGEAADFTQAILQKYDYYHQP